MYFRDEKELINIIKNKNFNEIKIIFKNNSFNIGYLNYFKETLLYLIENKASFEIINFILMQQQEMQQEQNLEKDNNNTLVLFHSIGYNNFKIAKLLLKTGMRLETARYKDPHDYDYLSVMEYLIKIDRLNTHNIFFIMNHSKYDEIITCYILVTLKRLNKVDILKEIFNYIYIDLFVVIRFLIIHKNKTPISKNELQKLINLNKRIININEIYNLNDDYLLLKAVNYNKVEIIKLILDYAFKNNIVLELNKTNLMGVFPLLVAAKKNNTETVRLLLEYASKNNITLDINKRDNKWGYYPFLYATKNNNLEMVKLLKEYASKNNIILKLDIRMFDGKYPLSYAKWYNNIEMIKLLKGH